MIYSLKDGIKLPSMIGINPKQIFNNLASFGAVRRRGASFFYGGILTMINFC
jgi:hypothetical protein